MTILLEFFNKIIFYFIFITTVNLSIEFTMIANASECRLVNLPDVNRNFIGRVDDLEYVRQYFFKENNLVLVGNSGVGKTQIAKEYAHLNKGMYQITLWIDGSKNINDQLLYIANAWNKEFACTKEGTITINEMNELLTIENLMAKLSKTKLNWLIIIDNAKDIHSIATIMNIRNSIAKGNILVTSKNSNGWQGSRKINSFQREESIELLSKLEKDKYSKNSLDDLAVLLGDYPLAIAQAFAFIKATPNISVSKYIELYENERDRLWQYEENLIKRHGLELPDNYNNTMKTALEINIKEIEKYSKKTFELLSILAFFSNQNIPESIINTHFNNDALEIGNALSLLSSYSLIDKKSKDVYWMHEISQSVIQSYLSIEQKKRSIQSGIDYLNKIIPKKLDLSIPLLLKEFYLLEQIEKLSEYADFYSLYSNALIDLYIRKLEYFLPEKRDAKASEEIIKEIDILMEKTKDISDITKARFHLMQAAYFAWILSDYDLSIDRAKVAASYLKSCNDAHEEHLMLYNRFAQTYILQGELELALQYSDLGQEIIKIDASVGNQDAFFQARAKIFEDLGDLENAYKNAEAAVARARKIDQESLANIPVLFSLAMILAKMDRCAESCEIAQHISDKINTKFADKINYFAATPLVIMSHCMNKMHKLEEATIYIEKSIGLFGQLSMRGAQKRYYAFAYMIYGDIKVQQEKYEEAQAYYIKAKEIYDGVLKKKQVHDISELYIKLAINSARLKNVYLASHYLEEHRKVFGQEHNGSIKIMMHLQEQGLYLQ